MNDTQYAGFWIRFAATMIDSLLLLLITYPLLYFIYGDQFFGSSKVFHGPAEILISYVIPIVLTIWLWIKFKGTPGKTILGLHIVDFKTNGPLNFKQSVIRYFGYFIMVLPLCLGFVLIAFEKHKRGWHDKLSGSAVIYKPLKS